MSNFPSLTPKELIKVLERKGFVLKRIHGSHERDEMIPSIDVVKKIATMLGTTVGYLLGETEDLNMFKDPDMLRRFNGINSFPKADKGHIIYMLDTMINSVKLKTITQHR
jgi:hypothetical protein